MDKLCIFNYGKEISLARLKIEEEKKSIGKSIIYHENAQINKEKGNE